MMYVQPGATQMLMNWKESCFKAEKKGLAIVTAIFFWFILYGAVYEHDTKED